MIINLNNLSVCVLAVTQYSTTHVSSQAGYTKVCCHTTLTAGECGVGVIPQEFYNYELHSRGEAVGIRLKEFQSQSIVI